MNAVLHRDAALFEHIRQLAHGVLRLGRRHTVTGHEYDLLRVSHLHRHVLEIDLAHHALLAVTGAGCAGRRAKRAKQDISDRAVHRTAHQHGKDEAGKTIERARDDQHVV